MVGRPGKYQARFTAGELDPLIQANTDEALYFKGASAMINAKPLPQGGFSNRWGTVSLGQTRNVLAFIGAVAATAPAGGTAANAIDLNPATYVTTGTISTPTIVLTVDLGSPQPISCFDIENFGCNLPGGAFPTILEPSPPLNPQIAGTLAVTYSAENVYWFALDNVVGLGDALRTRRFAAPAGAPVNARYFRVTINPTTLGGVVFNLANVRAFAETALISAARVRSFTHSRSLAYDVVFTDQNAEIYGINGRVASAPLTVSGASLTSSLIAAMKNAQQLDTMLLFHQQLKPLRILRQGADTEWNVDPAPFINIPNYDYGVGYSNGVAAQWQLSFFNFDAATGSIPLPSGGAHFTISVNGVASPAMQQPPGNYTGTAAMLQAAILALPGVGAGVTVVLTSGGTGGVPPIFTVTFGGTANAGNGWAISGVAVDKADAAITAANTVAGVLGGEPVISAARGWPGCGCFYQQRIVMGGLAGVPNAFLASQTGNYWQLSTKLTSSSAPMLVPLDTDGAATIVDIHSGRTLDFFCDSGEYWLSTGALDATVTPIIVRGTSNGIAATVDAFENEGKTYYVGKEGGSLFEFVFNYSEQNYDSNNVSVQSSSVVNNLVDAAMRRIAAATDLNELYAVRADGQAMLLALLRQQEINSFARLQTQGSFLAVNVNDRFEVTWIVSRFLAGQTQQWIERMTEGVVLDGQITLNVVAGATTLNVPAFGGNSVWAIVDGFEQGPFQVSTAGLLTLAFPALANGPAYVGLWSPALVKTLPQPKDVAPRTVVRRPCRVHTVRASVVGTSNIALGANGDGPYDVPIFVYGSPTDTPPMSAPYTGPVVCEGLQGFTEDGIVTLTQLRPGLLSVTGVTVEVDL